MSNIFLRSVLLKMQATKNLSSTPYASAVNKKQAFPTKNRLPADKFLPASDFIFSIKILSI